MEYIIKNYTAKEYPWNTTFYLNLIFEPIEESFKIWCREESDDYKKLTIVKDGNLSDYEKEIRNIPMISKDFHILDFSNLDKYMVQGYYSQNNILCRLKKPFTNIYRYCEVFEKNKIVEACLERLEFLSKNPKECNNQCELISILNTLNNWWY